VADARPKGVTSTDGAFRARRQSSSVVILIDSNIPMYLVGTPGPHKTDAQRLLEKLISGRQHLVTDAECCGKSYTATAP
jgi:hypothetical protein